MKKDSGSSVRLTAIFVLKEENLFTFQKDMIKYGCIRINSKK